MTKATKGAIPGAMGVQQLATTLGVNKKTVQQWMTEGCPHTRHGARDVALVLAEVWRWRYDQERKRTQDEGEAEQRRRKVAAEAELKEMEVALRRGEMAELAAVEQAWAAMLTPLRSQLTTLPGRLAPLLTNLDSPGQAQAVLDRAVRAMLESLTEESHGRRRRSAA